MINPNVSELLGFVCHHMDDEGTLAVIDTPFVFEDDDPIPVYVEQVGTKVRFFDDGEVIWHFMGLGIPMDSWGDSKFIEDLARLHDVSLNDRGELEIWADDDAAPGAFANYLLTIFEVVRWEREYNAAFETRRQQWLSAGAGTVSLNA
jgi:hypothetical protein